MSGKKSLIDVIYTEKKTTKDLFEIRFVDKETEVEFNNFNAKTARNFRIAFGLASTFYYISNTVFFWFDRDMRIHLSTFILYCLFTLVNALSFIVIMKTNTNSVCNRLMCYARFFFAYFRNIHYFVFIELFDNTSNKLDTFIRNHYFHCAIVFSDYIFFLKPSFIISSVTGFGWMSLIFYLNFINGNKLLPELISCIPLFFLNSSAIFFDDYKRKIFLAVKQSEAILRYFEGLINGMETQLITFNNDIPVFSNHSFLLKNKTDRHSKRESDAESTFSFKKDKTARSSSEINTWLDKYKNDLGHSLMDEIAIRRTHIIEMGKASRFKLLGQFTIIGSNRFFKIYTRQVCLEKKSVLIDILIDDITEIKIAELTKSETALKQKLFSKLAHEFKTPLLIIKSLITDWSNSFIDVDNSKGNECAIEISSNIVYLSEYLHFLINDIIFYSNSSSISINKEEIELKPIVDFCSKVCYSLIAVMPGNKSNVQCCSYYDPQLAYFTVFSDSVRLKQVLLNLISNSVKFTRVGLIEISAQYNEIENSVEIAVKDSGIGMREDELQKLKSDLIDSPLKLNINGNYNEMGTGLGIGIVKSIVSQLKHELFIKSAPGSGTEFKIVIKDIITSPLYANNEFDRKTLPCVHIHTSSLHKLLSNSKTHNTLIVEEAFNINFNEIEKRLTSSKYLNKVDQQLPINFGKRQIIVADDSISIRKSTIKLLSSNKNFKNFQFVECNDGIDILKVLMEEQVLNQSIDAVITDENMEYMCGSNAICFIRKMIDLNKFRKILIVSLTAFSDESTLKYIKSQGADLVLPKPITMSIIDTCLVPKLDLSSS